jgi:hypothetical protein
VRRCAVTAYHPDFDVKYADQAEERCGEASVGAGCLKDFCIRDSEPVGVVLGNLDDVTALEISHSLAQTRSVVIGPLQANPIASSQRPVYIHIDMTVYT